MTRDFLQIKKVGAAPYPSYFIISKGTDFVWDAADTERKAKNRIVKIAKMTNYDYSLEVIE